MEGDAGRLPGVEAAGSEHRGGDNKGLRDRHIMGRHGILPRPIEDRLETFREIICSFPIPDREGLGLDCLSKHWDIRPGMLSI